VAVCEAIEAASESGMELGAWCPPETETLVDRERRQEMLTSMSDAVPLEFVQTTGTSSEHLRLLFSVG
jgi:hypothetical protein